MAKSASSSRRLWFVAHSWLGLPIWAFLLFVCLTGTIATVSQEIMWLADPATRANPPSEDARPLGYDDVMAAVEQQRPGVRLHEMTQPVKPQFALIVEAVTPDGEQQTYYVNPYDGTIQGEQSWFDFREFIRALHGWLLTPFNGGYAIGWYAVSALSIPLMGSLVTGIVVHKKFWRLYLNPRLRISKGARIFWGDLHRLVAIWSLPFIAIISVTAMWFLAEAILYANNVTVAATPPPAVLARDAVPKIERGEAPPEISIDAAIAAIKEKHPDFSPGIVEAPETAYGHVTVYGRGAYPLIYEEVKVDPYSNEVSRSRMVSDRTALELVTESMRPLHVGDFAGIWLKLVYFLFGLMLTGMVFSGMLIWMKRTASATRAVIRDVGVPRPFPEPAE
ncbi:MAG: PepSY-associated TM helix domain-containing protein [Hansschlegelia sp.]